MVCNVGQLPGQDFTSDEADLYGFSATKPHQYNCNTSSAIVFQAKQISLRQECNDNCF
jgi:hypothetical protein